MKKTKKQAIIALLILATLILSVFFAFFQDTLYDDSTKYVETNQQYPTTGNYNLWTIIGSSEFTISGNEQNFRILGWCGGYSQHYTSGGTATSTQAFDNKDIMVDLFISQAGAHADMAGSEGCRQNAIFYVSNAQVYLGDVFLFTIGANQAGTLEIIQSIVENDKVYVKWQGQEKGSYTIPTTGRYLKFVYDGSGYIDIKNTRYKYLFDCNIENDEIAIRDSFTEGSTVDIHSLTYPPVKFCVDAYPALIRDMNEQGIATDVHGEITKIIARGETYTVQPNQVLYYHYIADYQEGMGERCGLDEAYDTKTKQCTKIIAEANDTTILIRDVVEYDVTDQARLYTGKEATKSELSNPTQCNAWNDYPLNIVLGDQTLTISKPQYSPSCDQKTSYSAPQPSPDCWTGTATLKGTTTNLVYGVPTKINDCITLTYVPTAVFDGGDDAKCLNPKQTLTKVSLFIDTDKCLLISPKTNDYYIIKNANKDATFTLYNNIGVNFNSEQSGINQKLTRDLLFSQAATEVPLAFKTGVTDTRIVLDTSEYGQVFYQVTPFIDVEGRHFTSSQQLIYNFEVVDTIPTSTEFTNVTNPLDEIPNTIIIPIINDEDTTPTPDNTSWLQWWWAIPIGLAAIGGIILITKKKAKRRR